MKTGPERGSHIPVLAKLLSITSGTVLELGCGFYSTIFLHWMCYPKRRKLVTYENDPGWFKFAIQFKNSFHDVYFVEDWDKIDLTSPWSIALVDHSPENRRVLEVRRLRHTDYVVLHDSEPRQEKRYHYHASRRFYRYKWQYRNAHLPYTSIWSDKVDLTGFEV